MEGEEANSNQFDITNVITVKTEPQDEEPDDDLSSCQVHYHRESSRNDDHIDVSFVKEEEPVAFLQCLVCSKSITSKDDVCCADLKATDLESPSGCPVKKKKRLGRKNIHGQPPFYCIFCPKTCNLKQQLDTHIRTHIEEKPHQCKYCSWTFCDSAALRRHELALHKGGLPSRYGCSYCDKKFYHTGHLDIHERSHTGHKPFKCHLCPDKAYTQKPHLAVHMRSCHTFERPFTCPTCSKGFSSSNALSTHRKRHSDARSWKCDLCGVTYKHTGALKRHMRAVHTHEKPYKCKWCGRGFVDQSDLSRHVRAHEGDKRYRCVFCERAFTQNGVLWVHLRVHVNEKPFDCLQCGNSFRSSTDLTKHAKSHSKVLEYSCVFCGKELKQKRSMDRHLLGHIGEKPVDCSKCGAVFQDGHALSRHIRLVHSA